MTLRVGIVSLESVTWTAGASYSKTLALALHLVAKERSIQVFLLARPDTKPPDGVVLLPVQQPDLSLRGKLLRHSTRLRERLPVVPGEWPVRRKTGWIDSSNATQVARAHDLDVIVPYVLPIATPGLRTIGWIPDFQHRNLPEFFGEHERGVRDLEYRAVASASDRVIVSSRAALSDFQQYLPDLAHRARVLSFPSLFALSPLAATDAKDVLAFYRLPDKFALVVNQFWSHKNHITVVRALGQLKRSGAALPVVMIGRPDDYRDPGNKSLSRLLQEVSSNGVRDEVAILGEVPFEHLVALMRAAALVIQPSRSEGWSTTVQDARALGRPLICADLPVLREQAPDALGFFPPLDVPALASVLQEAWQRVAAGPASDKEEVALARELEFARTFGNSLADLCLASARSSS